MEFASKLPVKSGLNKFKICEVDVKCIKIKEMKPHLKTWLMAGDI